MNLNRTFRKNLLTDDTNFVVFLNPNDGLIETFPAKNVSAPKTEIILAEMKY
jgi:hypothetical protein